MILQPGVVAFARWHRELRHVFFIAPRLHGEQREITVREDAPEDLRAALPLLAEQAGLTPTPIREVVCRVLLKRPDPDNWSERLGWWRACLRLGPIATWDDNIVSRYEPIPADFVEAHCNLRLTMGPLLAKPLTLWRGEAVEWPTLNESNEQQPAVSHDIDREIDLADRQVVERRDSVLGLPTPHVSSASAADEKSRGAL